MIAKEWEEIGFKCDELDRVGAIVCEKGERKFTFVDGEVYKSKAVLRSMPKEKKAIRAQYELINGKR